MLANVSFDKTSSPKAQVHRFSQSLLVRFFTSINLVSFPHFFFITAICTFWQNLEEEERNTQFYLYLPLVNLSFPLYQNEVRQRRATERMWWWVKDWTCHLSNTFWGIQINSASVITILAENTGSTSKILQSCISTWVTINLFLSTTTKKPATYKVWKVNQSYETCWVHFWIGTLNNIFPRLKQMRENFI